ncbi:Antigen 5 like allergen Cul n 1 [Pseudolycoriella hygida]|uniref:Antigen 5 like allergen Cul n 1 n=1 Tax=Pseudolycoriella hygida TaxID=35572 RepID=A0A9Q0MU58_9DIPT|nr:Antigen 5 like allergen Cul n 1 [Pseudolycoriella hygida]
MNSFVILFASAVLFVTSIAIDYCNLDLCPENRLHVGCAENSSDWGPDCSDDSYFEEMTKELKNFILKKHNKARNKIALGKVPGYLEADRMPEMVWNTELEETAELNAKRCKYGHDECRNTDKFRSVGQNIGIVTSNHTYFHKVTNVIGLYFDLWFEEYKDCNMSYIDDYQLLENKEVKIGHFTQIVAMKAKYVGCAMSKFLSGEHYEMNFYLVCNYSFGNRVSEPIYTTGPAASRCNSGRSLYYKGLCNSTEDIEEISDNVD